MRRSPFSHATFFVEGSFEALPHSPAPSMSMNMPTANDPAKPTISGEEYRRQFWRHIYDFPRIPVPIYRHAMPSAPWPWMSFDVDAGRIHPAPLGPDHSIWSGYPQNIFKNWTRDQVDRSQMLVKCSNEELSTVYKINLLDDGSFDQQVDARKVRKGNAVDLQAYWDHLATPLASNVRVQTLFVDEMTLPILQILGTRYNVEPFFFASSVNWIPSRYQEDYKALEDHITVVLPFLRILKKQRPVSRTKPLRMTTLSNVEVPLPYTEDGQMIDTQAPLPLPENRVLIQDLLSLHMLRNTTTSTIISYHSTSSFQGTSAVRLQHLVQRIGDSVYWSKIFKKSKDSTFLFLAVLWYALYEWDEAFEVLFGYINVLEHDVLQSNSIELVRELHKLQANLMHYQQLLRDFNRSVQFVKDTPNPAMKSSSISEQEREESAKMLQIEANNLTSEIVRLTLHGEMMADRLDNVIRLTFATQNIKTSKDTRDLSELAIRDSTTMKQIAYLSTLFLPAIYLANVFSMNVREINSMSNVTPYVPPPTTLANYIETTVGLSVLTSWVAIALKRESSVLPAGSGVLHRTLWPLFLVYGIISAQVRRWFGRRAPLDTLH